MTVNTPDGQTSIGILVPNGGSSTYLAEGLGWFTDSTHLHLGWSDETYGGYCGELTFTKQ